MSDKKPNKAVVIGTIGQDAHMIGAWVLTQTFRDAGYQVAFLGAVVPQEDFINAAIEINADAILCSSLYGMGIIDCEGMRDKCIEAGIGDIKLYAGGQVAAPIDLATKWPEIERRFAEMGFDRVFPNTTMADETLQIISCDLGLELEK